MKKSLIAIGLLSFLFIGTVSADATREDMLKMFPEAVLDSMTPEQLAKYATLDYDNLVEDETIIPVSEYPSEISPLDTTLVTTLYKKVRIVATPYSDGITYAIGLTNLWLAIPSTRSYDVIALRFDDMVMANGSQSGWQFYTPTSTNVTQSIGYSYNGTNMVLKENGYGISMNLINDDINYLENFTSVDVAVAGSNPVAWGSYQHATSNVTLAQSQDYNISYAGLGYVINFDPSVDGYYDATPGVKIIL